MEHYLAEFIIALILAIAGQTVVLVWKLSAITTKLEALGQAIHAVEGPNGSIAQLWKAIGELRDRISALEGTCRACNARREE